MTQAPAHREALSSFRQNRERGLKAAETRRANQRRICPLCGDDLNWGEASTHECPPRLAQFLVNSLFVAGVVGLVVTACSTDGGRCE